MPIARKQFEDEQDTCDIRILEYLRKNPDLAFTAKEIADRLGEDHLDVVVSLNRLSEEMVERKMMDGEHYFAIKKILTRFIETLL